MTQARFLIFIAVVLVVFGIVISDGCKKDKVVHTRHMGGIRKWHCSMWKDSMGISVHNEADRTFALAVIDEETVSMAGYIFTFTKEDTKSHVRHFGQEFVTIAYFYDKDSIVYTGKLYNSSHYVGTDVWYTYK